MKALDKVTKMTINKYKYNFFDEEKLLSEIAEFDYSKITIINKVDDFSQLTDPIDLKIKNAPDNFSFKIIKKDDDGNYALTSSSEKINKLLITDFKVDDFEAKIIYNLNAAKVEIAGEIKSKVENGFKELLAELYNTSISKTEDYVYLTTEYLNPKIDPLIKKGYNFYFLKKNKNIYVKVCKVDDTKVDDAKDCDVYGAFITSISEGEFVNSITNQHDEFQDDNKNNQTAIEKVYYMILTKKQGEKTKELKKEISDSITSIFQKIENAKNTYSGQFVINKNVPLFIKNDKKIKNNVGNKKSHVENENEITLEIDSVNIRFFNNRADNIIVVGHLSNDEENTRVFTNRFYSLPLREFNHRNQTNTLFDKEGDSYTYYYDDVIDFLPYKKFNYAVKNGEIKLGEKDSIKAVERKIGDYFTGIFFSDFLGLNTNNSNSLIVAEGRIRIPWNLRNYGRQTLFDNITAYASVNLFSGFEDNSRKIELDDTLDADETSEANAQNFTTDNFNLLTNNNIDAGILVTPYTFEWKGASTFIHLRYGLRFIRTGAEYNLKEQNTILVDNTPTVQETIVERKGFQVYSIGQEAEVNFEIRPQSSVGADVTVGLNWFRANGTNKNDVDFSTTNNSPNLKVMANIYALTNSEDSNSGVYFRLGGHYNLGSYKVFPQIMVGYATNLSSFVNKLKKED
ncbi:MAG: hypothetical protein ABJK28_15090 [Algibacter sp.]